MQIQKQSFSDQSIGQSTKNKYESTIFRKKIRSINETEIRFKKKSLFISFVRKVKQSIEQNGRTFPIKMNNNQIFSNIDIFREGKYHFK